MRRLLAVLVTRVNYLASADWLADCVWGDRQPAISSGALHNLIWRLRAVLSAAGVEDVKLLTQPPGYCLKLKRSSLDSLLFEDLVVSARAQIADDPAAAAERLDEALSWWQGPAYAEFADEEFARPSAARLTELKMLAEEDRAEADLLLGRPEAACARLTELAMQYPLRERLHAQLMLATYRLGRPADAAEIYRSLAHRIRRDLGLDPTPRLRDLHARILRADPTLIQSRSHPLHTRVDARNGPSSAAPPAPLNQPLYGRDSAVAEVCDALGVERVVTLSGPGGVGKTSLARAVLSRIAGRYRDGAHLCELTTVARSQSILAPMARALQMPAEVGEISATAIISYLADRQMLLVLDNCEHVLDEVIDITARIMQRCPGLVVLTTSRAPLRVAEERVVPVPPLRVPPVGLDGVAAIGEYEAVQLFWARARQRHRSFDLAGSAEAVAELCRRLDGLPLALELAAARMTTMAPAELVERLQWRLDVLQNPRDHARHRTLRHLVEWSFVLLSEPEQRLFEIVSVFSGPFTMHDAEAVVQDLAQLQGWGPAEVINGIDALVESSMLSVLVGEPTRYSMLETLRGFGREHLGARPYAIAVRRAHARHFAALATATYGRFGGRGEQAAFLRLDGALSEFRAAFWWSVENDLQLAVDLAGNLNLLLERGVVGEVAQWATKLINDFGSRLDTLRGAARVYAIAANGELSFGHFDATPALCHRGLALVGNDLAAMRYLRWILGEHAASRDDVQEMLRQITLIGPVQPHDDHASLRADLECDVVQRRFRAGVAARIAAEHARRIQAVAERHGWPEVAAWALRTRGFVLTDAAPAEADASLVEALRRSTEVDDQVTRWFILHALATVRARYGDPEQATALYRDVLRLWLERREWVSHWPALYGIVDLWVRLRRWEPAMVLLAALRARDSRRAGYGPEGARLSANERMLKDKLDDVSIKRLDQRGRAMSDRELLAYVQDELAASD